MSSMWDFPLDPTIWGTVGQWAGSVASAGALWVAALVYRSNSKRDREAQAKQIRIFEASDPNLGIMALNPKPFVVVVHNLSDRSISSVSAHINKRPLVDVVTDYLQLSPVPAPNGELERMRQESIASINDGFPTTPPQWKLEPGAEHEFKFPNPIQPIYQVCVVYFTDSQGQQWKKTLEVHPFKDSSLELIQNVWPKLTRFVRRGELLFAPKKGFRRLIYIRKIRREVRIKEEMRIQARKVEPFD
ncbi:hypothetical protein ACIBJI_41455 [Nocardia sp. NPDC050408]|uniref:hypothetical protein n=1 Tax=Nocardia sp. NPDC050408 TaxID=3364319 RepID=UPI0037AE5268